MIPARLVRAMDRKNVVAIVFAGGNSNGLCAGPSILCINSNEGGITTAALDRSGNPQDYSSRGPGQCSGFHPFIAAPTFGVLPWGASWLDFGEQGGATSACAPQVSGALAIMKSRYPGATNNQMRAAMAMSAQRRLGIPALAHPLLPIPIPGYRPDVGFGMLQVDRAAAAVPRASFHPLNGLLTGLSFLPSPASLGLPLAPDVKASAP